MEFVLLQELLNAPFKFRIVQDDDDISAFFKDETDTTVSLNAEWWLNPECYIIDFRRAGSYKMTNDGPAEKHQAMRIFATVIEIIRKIVADKNPPFIGFSAAKNEESRVSLYDRLVKRLASSLGYVDVTETPELINHEVMPKWMANHKRLLTQAKPVYLARKDMLK